MWQLLIVTFFDWWEIQFDQVWSSLIHFGQIWSKEIENQIAIFILFVNVKTFSGNILWFVRNPIWSSLLHFGQIWSKKIQNKTANFILFVWQRQIIASKHKKGWQTSKNREMRHKSETEVITRRRAWRPARLKNGKKNQIWKSLDSYGPIFSLDLRYVKV